MPYLHFFEWMSTCATSYVIRLWKWGWHTRFCTIHTPTTLNEGYWSTGWRYLTCFLCESITSRLRAMQRCISIQMRGTISRLKQNCFPSSTWMSMSCSKSDLLKTKWRWDYAAYEILMYGTSTLNTMLHILLSFQELAKLLSYKHMKTPSNTPQQMKPGLSL